ncbi:MAG: orotate phosphoribosyltransferase [Parcubacteria group bacterium]|jgi:orotate phosphoribosyltransferase
MKKDELLNMLLKKSFQFSEKPIFKLVSGQMSQFYINCKPTTMNSRGMILVGKLVFDAVSDIENLTGIGGLTFGADPIAVATAYTYEINGRSIKALSIRKTQKDHGIVRWVEGGVELGDIVVIIDDVATTGGSTIKAIERARADGLDVAAVVILVDRQEGGIENIKKHVPDVRVIITREELFSAYQAKNNNIVSLGSVS